MVKILLKYFPKVLKICLNNGRDVEVRWRYRRFFIDECNCHRNGARFDTLAIVEFIEVDEKIFGKSNHLFFPSIVDGFNFYEVSITVLLDILIFFRIGFLISVKYRMILHYNSITAE